MAPRKALKAEKGARKDLKKIEENRNENRAKSKAESRCSPQLFITEMKKLDERITPQQRDAVMRTPFSHFLQCSPNYNNAALMESIVDKYNDDIVGFAVGKGVTLSFPSTELSCVLGLRDAGVHVHPGLKKVPTVVRRFFDGKLGNVNRTTIIKVLHQIAGNEEWAAGERDIEDFARVFILFLFNTILFPTAHKYVPPYIIHYVDDLESIDEYAWGEAVHAFLVNSLKKRAEGRTYVDGCTFGLVVRSYLNVLSILYCYILLCAEPYYINVLKTSILNC